MHPEMRAQTILGHPIRNAWRAENEKVRPDLSGADLNGADLNGANLSFIVDILP